MPLVQTRGAASAQGFGEFAQASAIPNYIEDVFSTYLYTGNSSTNNIVNNIDLAGKGGMVWIKSRTSAASHALWDTARTPYYYLDSNATSAEQSVGSSNALTSYNADGFTVTGGSNAWNGSQNYTSWTFRKQPKFFDVVTWTGDGNATKTISHNLGSIPGCIMVKLTSGSNGWDVYHQSLGTSKYVQLNTTSASTTISNVWGTITSTTFTATGTLGQNDSGATYVAYLFANNAGGFGLTGTDNVISCGSYTGSNSTATTVTLGYEPQWIMIKRATGATSAYTGWAIFDNMRGMPVSGNDNTLLANTSDAENPVTANGAFVSPTATGFTLNVPGSNLTNTPDTYIYIAIRRGPMKVPTDATKVYNTILQTPQSTGTLRTVGFPADLVIGTYRSAATGRLENSRLTGFANNSGSSQDTPGMFTNATTAEANNYPLFYNVWNTTARDGDYIFGANGVNWAFGRAPSFFDEVCYTGTGSTTTITHNLGVTPELVITKSRSQALGWVVWTTSLTNTDYWIRLDDTMAQANSPVGYGGTFSASNYTIANTGPYNALNNSGSTYVAYLFATCAGVSKCTAFTGTGTLQTINCGFTSGARFVLIKRTDSTGDWYVWDSSRGLSSSTDPYLLLNSTAAEVTSTNWVDTTSTGFQVTAASGNNVNINGASYIALAIA